VGDEARGDPGGFLAQVVAGFGSGSRIAGYRLEGQIGAGGMAVVFRARDERLGRLVALKILAPALAADEAFRQRFIRESRASARVDDPHIIPVFEAGEADGVLFIAMRYVPGGDVRTLLDREGPLPAARAAAIISLVASALDAAHAAGLVHRDVKPANMLVDTRPGRPDHVYLSDFGLSKGAMSSAALTGTGQFLGTLEYVAPEQIEGKPVDGRTDQYALACAAFELLCGAPPFRRDEAAAVMYAKLSEPPPSLASRLPGLPPAVDEVFARALAKPPDGRYSSCREFADALGAALGIQLDNTGPGIIQPGHPATDVVTFSRLETGIPALSPAAATVSAAARGRRARLLLAAVVVIALTAGAAALILRPHGAPPAAPAQTAASLPSVSASASGRPETTPARTVAGRSGLLAGNVSPRFPAGTPGKVAVVAQGDLVLHDLASGESVPIAVRNNTSRPVTQIMAQGLVRSSAGAPVASGSDQGFSPSRLQPGQVALGYIYLQTGNTLPAGSTLSVQASATPSSSPATYIADLAVTQVNNTGQEIVGVARNPRGHSIQGPYGVNAFCVTAAGRLLATFGTFADSTGNLAAGASTSFTIDLTGRCPHYLVGASGFDKSDVDN
jgi:protein kinase-like protein